MAECVCGSASNLLGTVFLVYWTIYLGSSYVDSE